MEYKVILKAFEGPLDLLYHLIKKAEVDIYDIPIAEIANQYIEYIRSMEELDLDVTSEFLVMAATLLEIKSKMLLPKQEEDGIQLEIEEIDPRDELVRRLIEYKKYKEAAKELKIKEEVQMKVFFKNREEIEQYISNDEPILEGIKISDLFKALEKIVEKQKDTFKQEFIKEIKRDELTIEESMEEIMKLIRHSKTIKFEDLFKEDISKVSIVVTFLAVLELIKLKSIVINQDRNFGEIYIQYNKAKLRT